MLTVQLAETAVEIEFLLGQAGEFGVVGAALGLGDEGAELALTMLDGALVDLLNCTTDFNGIGGLNFGQKRLGEQGALGLVFDNFHGVAGLTAGQ